MNIPVSPPAGVSPFAFCFQSLSQVVIPVDQGVGGLALLSQSVFNFSVGEKEEKSTDGLSVERYGASDEVVLDEVFLLIRDKRTMFSNELFLKHVESGADGFRVVCVGGMMEGHLDQSAAEVASLHGARFRVGKTFSGTLNSENPHARFITRHLHSDVHLMLLSPVEQPIRRVTPLQSERRLQHSLAMSECANESKCDDKPFRHGLNLHATRRSNKRSRRAGWILLEATYAMTFLTALGLILLKLGMNITAPRQWTLQQTITDSYMTYEKALAQRMSYADLTDSDSPWPLYPAKSEETVALGKLPGGGALSGTVYRTRIPDDINTAEDNINPTGVQVWKFTSVLVYDIRGTKYRKSRTVVRSQ